MIRRAKAGRRGGPEPAVPIEDPIGLKAVARKDADGAMTTAPVPVVRVVAPVSTLDATTVAAIAGMTVVTRGAAAISVTIEARAVGAIDAMTAAAGGPDPSAATTADRAVGTSSAKTEAAQGTADASSAGMTVAPTVDGMTVATRAEVATSATTGAVPVAANASSVVMTVVVRGVLDTSGTIDARVATQIDAMTDVVTDVVTVAESGVDSSVATTAGREVTPTSGNRVRVAATAGATIVVMNDRATAVGMTAVAPSAVAMLPHVRSAAVPAETIARSAMVLAATRVRTTAGADEADGAPTAAMTDATTAVTTASSVRRKHVPGEARVVGTVASTIKLVVTAVGSRPCLKA